MGRGRISLNRWEVVGESFPCHLFDVGLSRPAEGCWVGLKSLCGDAEEMKVEWEMSAAPSTRGGFGAKLCVDLPSNRYGEVCRHRTGSRGGRASLNIDWSGCDILRMVGTETIRRACRNVHFDPPIRHSSFSSIIVARSMSLSMHRLQDDLNREMAPNPTSLHRLHRLLLVLDQ